jgi:hypothetical protein
MSNEHEHDHGQSSSRSPGRWVLIGFILVGGFFLFTEHRAHLFGVLPYLLLAACPLMHIFGHGHGHGGHGGHGGDGGSGGSGSTDNVRPAGTGNSGPTGHQHS